MKNDNQKVLVRFHEGTVVVDNLDHDQEPDFCVWDHRTEYWRAKAIYYSDIIKWLKSNNINYVDKAQKYDKLNIKLNLDYQLYSYQKNGVQAWKKKNFRGSIILPTGSGKSYLAVQAIYELQIPTLIVLPTIDLMNQWYDLLTEAFDLEIGILGGGYHEIKQITVTTYDSAQIYIDTYGCRFGFIIFDEVHHLPSTVNAQIAEMCIAPYRLGLTATYHRTDGLQGKLDRLLGPVVYQVGIDELTGNHLANFDIIRIKIDLTPNEKKEYQEYTSIYRDFVKDTDYKFTGPDLQKFLKEVNLRPDARKALLAKFNSRKIVLNAARKLDILELLLKQHHKDRMIIFTENNELVYKIAVDFFIPALTHQTKTKERKLILSKFRSGEYSVLVTSKVLNEGVDVPEANVGVILSGSGSPTEYLQRLGRLLRKGENKQAILYEIITKGTSEVSVSYRRRSF